MSRASFLDGLDAPTLGIQVLPPANGSKIMSVEFCIMERRRRYRKS